MRAGSSNEGLDRQVSHLHFDNTAEPSKLMSQVYDPQYRRVSPPQNTNPMTESTVGAAAPVPWDSTEHGFQSGLRKHPQNTMGDEELIQGDPRSSFPRPVNPLAPISIQDFGHCLSESDQAETDFSELLTELREDLVDMNLSSVVCEHGHTRSTENHTVSLAIVEDDDPDKHCTNSKLGGASKALKAQTCPREEPLIPFIDELYETTSLHQAFLNNSAPIKSKKSILTQERLPFQGPESLQGASKPWDTQTDTLHPHHDTKYDQLVNDSASSSSGQTDKDNPVVRAKTSFISQGKSYISNVFMPRTSRSCNKASALPASPSEKVKFSGPQPFSQPVEHGLVPLEERMLAEAVISKLDLRVPPETPLSGQELSLGVSLGGSPLGPGLEGHFNERRPCLLNTCMKDYVPRLGEMKPEPSIEPQLMPCIAKYRNVPEVMVARSGNLPLALASEVRGNKDLSFTPEASRPSSPESIASQNEFRSMSPDSPVPDYRVPECINSINGFRPCSPGYVYSENGSSDSDMGELYSEYTLNSPEYADSLSSEDEVLCPDSPIPQFKCPQPEVFISVVGAASSSVNSLASESDIEYDVYSEEWPNETRLPSPGTMSLDGHRPLSPDSPVPEYGHPTSEQFIYMSDGSLSPSSLASDIEYAEFCLDELFNEDRPNSPESSYSYDTCRPLSPDSPVPLYGCNQYEQLVYGSN